LRRRRVGIHALKEGPRNPATVPSSRCGVFVKLWSRLSPSHEKQRTKRLVTPRIVTDHIMMREDYERLHEFLLETDNLSEISNDLRKVIEEEWPELVYKLPPKA
jgi:hypothetical protein